MESECRAHKPSCEGLLVTQTVIAAEFGIGGTFSPLNEDIHLDSGKNAAPNGGLKFEEVGSYEQDRGGLHRIGTTISEKVVSNHRIVPWTLKNPALLSDPATLKI
jgi:hypothetical protein